MNPQREKKLFYKYESKTTGKNDFKLTEKALYGAGRNYFPSQEDAKAHFEQSYNIALNKYEKIIAGMKKLKESIGDFSYDYFFHGDTYGIYEEGLYISIEVNGYDFQFPQEY